MRYTGRALAVFGVTVCLTLFAPLAFAQTIRYVDDDAAAGGDGTSWPTAYKYLQDALAAAQPGFEIRVAQGTYRPDENEAHPNPDPPDRDATFQLVSEVILKGGYAGAGAPDPDARDVGAYVTLLSGDLKGDDLPSFGMYTDNSLHVVTAGGTAAGTLLDGLTVQAGNANSPSVPNDRGGGLLIQGGNVDLVNCRIRLHSAYNSGGAICNTGVASISNCEITNNVLSGSAWSNGAGMFNGGGSRATLTGCLLRDNWANTPPSRGGAIHSAGATEIVLNDCEFIANKAYGYTDLQGGALYNTNVGSLTIDGCSFVQNFSEHGGAICNVSVSNIAIHGCSFDDNTGNFTGGAVSNTDSGVVGFEDCTFWSNNYGTGTGVYNQNTSPVFKGCSFLENYAGAGTGVYNKNSAPVLIDCVFIKNSASGNSGGALYNENSNPVLINCLFAGNQTYHAAQGGAIYNDSLSEPVLVNCAFTGNKTESGNGGAIANFGNPTLVNCTFSQNVASASGGGIYTAINAASLQNCVFWGNHDSGGSDESAQINVDSGRATVDYSCIQGLTGDLEGLGNIGVDPRFVDLDGADDVVGTIDDDLRLMNDSPCIDAADNTAVPPDTYDIDDDSDTTEPLPLDVGGGLRLTNDPFTLDTGSGSPPIVDMGAYEFQPTDCNSNGIPDDPCDFDCGEPGGPCDLPGCGQSLDCNDNHIPDECEPDCDGDDIPDECEIADCPDEPACSDCNANLIPDGCDIADDSSEDCQPDGIPDECQTDNLVFSEWRGATACKTEPYRECWSTAANWCPDAIPNNTVNAQFNVIVAGETSIITLDLSPTIEALEVSDQATIEVNADSGASVRTLAVGTAIANGGKLRATEGRRLLIDASDIDQDQEPEGVIEASGLSGEASKIQINGQTVTGGTIRTEGENAAVELLGGAVLVDVTIEGGGKSNGPSQVRVPDGQAGMLGQVIVNDGLVSVGEAGLDTPTYLMPTEDGVILCTPGGTGRVLMANRHARLGDFFGSTVNASEHRIEGAGVIFGTLINDEGACVAANHAVDPLVISPPGIKVNDGTLLAIAGGRLRILDNITGFGCLSALGATVEVGDDDEPVIIDEDGPVIVDPGSTGLIEVRGSQLLGAVYWEIGNEEIGPDKTATLNLLNESVGVVLGPVHVHQNGTLRITNSSLEATGLILDDGAELFVSSNVTLSGSLDSGMTDASGESWSWAAGSDLVMTGGLDASATPCSLEGWSMLEAVSADTGPAGGHGDFEFADIILADGAHVSLVDHRPNHAPPVVAEAVYCDSLTLGAGAVLNLNGHNLYVGGFLMEPGPSGTGTVEDVARVSIHGDFDGDEEVTLDDVPAFVAALLQPEADPASGCRADVDEDGHTDGRDIQAFVDRVLAL